LVEGLTLYLILMGIPPVHATAIRAVLFLPFAGGMLQTFTTGLAIIFSQILRHMAGRSPTPEIVSPAEGTDAILG
jgi:hypothetical protein